MLSRRAIDLALEFARKPALVTVIREEELPSDILNVIQIAAGCPEASVDGMAATHQPLCVLRPAAIFFLEQILFFPGASLYRNLGVSTGASREQMRLHMRWLLQWLHPDHNSDETAALLALRVINAWRELGRSRDWEGDAPEELSYRPSGTYDRRYQTKTVIPWIAIPISRAPYYPWLNYHNAINLVLAATIVFVLILISDVLLFGSPALFIGEGPAASTTIVVGGDAMHTGSGADAGSR
jgi:hypothetical protein